MKTATAIAFGLALLAVVCLCKGDAMAPNTNRGDRSSQMGRRSWGQGQLRRVMGGSGKMGTLGNVQGQGRGGEGQWQDGQQCGGSGGGSQGGMMGGRGISGSQGGMMGGRNWQQ